MNIVWIAAIGGSESRIVLRYQLMQDVFMRLPPFVFRHSFSVIAEVMPKHLGVKPAEIRCLDLWGEEAFSHKFGNIRRKMVNGFIIWQ